MNVLLLGSGGREHAIAWKLSQSSLLRSLHLASGNGGTSDLGVSANLDLLDFPSIERYIRKHDIELVVVGPEAPLVAGISDYLEESTKINVKVVGPRKAGAMIEGSKEFAKKFMARHNIPTARYGSFGEEEFDDAVAFLDSFNPPYVIKADGLAAGKGVVITPSKTEAKKALRSMLIEGAFDGAGKRVVVEEFLEGKEVSMFAVTDGHSFHLLPSAKDYKRVGDGNSGANTGGMGAVSPVSFLTEEFQEKALNQIIIPTIKGLAKESIPYVGFVFFGLIKVGSDPFVIEYNCRLGDPETEVMLPRIKSDLLHLFDNLCSGLLSEYDLVVDDRAASTVVLASEGYPDSCQKELEIRIDETVSQIDGHVFHSGTRESRRKLLTNGGRVLALTGRGNNLKEAIKNSYALAERIQFQGAFYRTDIGQDVLEDA
ncbi:MAG: phosphoribosylamine--glycine ligase [Flavobacteriales bacterium]|nr:phosphoribosylamine--glycine ligase [Flavobacteriales bacterium]